MLVKKVSFPIYEEDITEVQHSNLDVFVTLEDDSKYNVNLATADNLEFIMDYDKMNYLEPGNPIIIVKSLTQKIIDETIQAYSQKKNGYWLTLYNFAGYINQDVFDQLQSKGGQQEFTKLVIKSIRFPTYLENSMNIEDKKISVFVELENGYTFNVVVTTPKNLESLMDDDEMNYLTPGQPCIMVKTLTKEIIEETIQSYAQERNGYWLKLYHFAGDIYEHVFDQLKAKHIEERKKRDELRTLDKAVEQLDGVSESLKQLEGVSESLKQLDGVSEALKQLIVLKEEKLFGSNNSYISS